MIKKTHTSTLNFPSRISRTSKEQARCFRRSALQRNSYIYQQNNCIRQGPVKRRAWLRSSHGRVYRNSPRYLYFLCIHRVHELWRQGCHLPKQWTIRSHSWAFRWQGGGTGECHQLRASRWGRPGVGPMDGGTEWTCRARAVSVCRSFTTWDGHMNYRQLAWFVLKWANVGFANVAEIPWEVVQLERSEVKDQMCLFCF